MKNLIYTVLFLFLLNSCDSFIDQKPLDKISMDNYWKSPDDLENYTNYFYSLINTSSIMIASEQHTDNLIVDQVSIVMNGERTLSTGNWAGAWRNIRDINIFFDNYHNVESSLGSYQHFLGEAHFFRAWFYFGLLKTYGDLPWYSSAIEIDDEEELYRHRDSRTLIVDSILVDLDKAFIYLDDRATVGNNRISKEAALAFKTRVALYEGSWQKYHANTPFGTPGANPNKYFQECVEAGEELMSGKYTVDIYNTGNPDNDYFDLFGFNNMSGIDEVILYRAFNAEDGEGNRVQYEIIYGVRRGVTWDLVSSYLGKDGKPYDYMKLAETTKGNPFLNKIAIDVDNRLKSTIWIPGDLLSATDDEYFVRLARIDEGDKDLVPTGFQIKKTGNPYDPTARYYSEISSETGYIILRYGEVLLNFAEAKYELNNTVAYDKLNLLRERVGMPEFTINPQSADPNLVDYGYPVSDELYEIRRERRVELALEGSRQGDYMRWAAHSLFKGKRPKGYPFNAEEFPIFTPLLDNNGLIDYYVNDMPNGYQFRPGQDYLNSIPQNEIVINPNLTQNPGW